MRLATAGTDDGKYLFSCGLQAFPLLNLSNG